MDDEVEHLLLLTHQKSVLVYIKAEAKLVDMAYSVTLVNQSLR